MRRKLRIHCAASALLLLTVSCALWCVSLLRAYTLLVRGATAEAELVSLPGRLVVVWHPDEPRDPFDGRPMLEPVPSQQYPDDWRTWGFAYVLGQKSVNGAPAKPYWRVSVPYYAPSAVSALLAAPAAASWVRHRRRLGAGHCRACGYDLRATPARCPECGTSPTGATT